MIDIIFIFIIIIVMMKMSLTIEKKKNKILVKKKKYFTKPNELGVIYEEDEKGKITKFQDGQQY